MYRRSSVRFLLATDIGVLPASVLGLKDVIEVTDLAWL